MPEIVATRPKRTVRKGRRPSSEREQMAASARALALIHASNQALVHATDETALLETVCRLAVDTAGYRLAWVGYAEDDPGKSVRPAASAGQGGDYVKSVKASWADVKRGQGPAGTAIRESRTVIAHDIIEDPRMGPWREAAAKHGFRSSIAIPLRAEGRVFGALMVYAAAPNAFDAAETRLLEELADDLAFGITALRTRRQNRAVASALRESEAKFRSLVETSRDWIWETDAKGRITYSSPRATELLGFAAEELLGRPYLSLAAQEDADRLRETLREVSGLGRAFDNVVARLRAKDGREVVFEISGEPFFAEHGSLLGWRGASRDVTDRNRASAELARQAAVLEAVQEAGPDGVLVVGPNAEIVAHNRRFADLFEIPAELLAFGDDGPVLRRVLAMAKDPDRFLNEVQAYYANPGRSGRDELFLADGRVLDRFTTPVRMEDGGYVGRVWFFRDITDKIRAEAERDRQAAIISAVQDTSPDGVLVVGPAGDILAHNQRLAEVFRLPEAVFASGLEAPVLERAVAATADPKRTVSRVRDYYVHPERSGRDLIPMADGRMVDQFTAPVHLADGEYLGRVWFFRDITDKIQAEAERARQAAIMSAVQETSVDGILLVDPQGEVVLHNRRFGEIFGLSQAQLDSKSDETLLQGALSKVRDPEAFLSRVRELYAHPGATSQEEVELLDGRTFERISAPVSLPGGEGLGRVWFFRDITERKSAEQRIRDDEARYRGLVEQEVVGIYTIDAEGRMAYINPWFAHALGFSQDEVIGRPFSDFVADGELKKVRSNVAARLSGNTPTAQYTSSLKRKDGGVMDVMIHSARTNIQGKPSVLGVLIDITEQRKAEAESREKEGRFTALVEQEIAGVYMIAPDGTVAYVNPGFLAMLGYTREEVVGRPFTDFIAPESHAEAIAGFQADMTGSPSPSQMTIIGVRKDGARIDILVHGSVATLNGQLASIGVVIDITDQKAAERSLLRANRILQTLTAGDEALVRATSEEELLSDMCRILVERGGYRMAWFGAPQDDAHRTVRPVASFGSGTDYIQSAAISWSETDPHGRGIAGRAIRTGKPQTSQNFAADPRMAPWQVEAARRGFASSAALPLKDDGHVFGLLSIYSGEPDAFDSDELALLLELAGNLSYGIKSLKVRAEREAAVQRWRKGLESTISAIAGTMEMRDPYTAGHQQRVARLAVAIARELKLPEDQIQGIHLAGIIHDIGKITVPSELLTKPGKLTPLEYQLIQTHAQAGYEVVKGVDFPWPIAEVILQHHERLDGSGYPQGLKGDEIIEEAKVLAVADVVDAMMSHRPYRPARGAGAALAEIEANKGKLYDAAAADACLRLFREKGFKIG